MSEHTPGPWGRGQFSSQGCHVLAPNADDIRLAWCPVASIVTRFGAYTINAEEAAANARLIAAAPDLLAACKAALGAFEHNNAIDWSELERAIAKAEGGGMSTATIPLHTLVDARDALRSIKDLQPHHAPTVEQWMRVMHACAALDYRLELIMGAVPVQVEGDK